MAGIENLFSVQDEYIILLYKYEAPGAPQFGRRAGTSTSYGAQAVGFSRTQSGMYYTGLGSHALKCLGAGRDELASLLSNYRILAHF